MLTDVDQGMLTGIDITSHGKVHTMHMGVISVDSLVLLNALELSTPPAAWPEAAQHLLRLAGRATHQGADDLAEHLLAYARHLNEGKDVVPDANDDRDPLR